MTKREFLDTVFTLAPNEANAIMDAFDEYVESNVVPTDRSGKERRMSRLDDTISNVAYILDTLIAYRNIVQSGGCNDCKEKMRCKFIPKLGEQVRYNCPFYKGKEVTE